MTFPFPFLALERTLGSPVTAVQVTLDTNASVTGAANTRVWFNSNLLTGSGTQIRVTLANSTALTLGIGSMYVGTAALSGNFYDFAGDQVRLLFGGAGSVTIPTSGPVVSDWADFAFNSSRPLVLAYLRTGSGGDRRKTSGLSADYRLAYNSLATDDSSNTTVSGYSSLNGAITTVTKIEVR